MASAKKLPSGAWRCKPEIRVNGKKISKSFTVSPKEFSGSAKEASRKAKAQAELLARAWQLEHEATKFSGKTVGEAMNSYISTRSNVLSDTTYIGYMSEMRSLKKMHDVYVQDVDSEMIQSLINELEPKLAPKSIQNRIRFLTLCLRFAGNEKRFNIRLPRIPKRDCKTPDHEDVSFLLDKTQGIMKTIICIAAFGGLRQGEISSLKEKDIIRDMSMIYVHSDMIKSKEGGYMYKDHAKTPDSTRTVHLPKEIIEMIPIKDDPESYVIGVRPNCISKRFKHLKKKYGLQYNFHDLRHYATSMRSDLGLSEKYIKRQLGWSGSSKMFKDVYDNPLNSEVVKFRKITNDFISEKFGNQIKQKA